LSPAPARRIHVAVNAVVVEQGKILLCRISPRVVRAAGQWTLPGGGVEFGEEPSQAFVRELWEETGLRSNPEALLDVLSSVITESEEELHVFRLIYSASVEPGVIRSEADGSTDLADWFSLEQAARLPLTPLGQRGLELASRILLPQ
jgi:ADP-ribose pyrophosphatase YjhB (NUDIX family)